jgi:hypothetical protein
MSTLVAQTLSNGTVSTSTANCISGSAKAWVNFNGTGTVAIRASYNVSSITDGGTGTYTVNFTNAMPDTNYTIISNAYLGTLSPRLSGGGVINTSSFILYTLNGGINATEDQPQIFVSVNR